MSSCQIIAPTAVHNGCFAFPIFSGFRDRSSIGIETGFHTLDDLKRRRTNEVAFLLAKLTLEKYFRDDDGNDKSWFFPQLLGIAKCWLNECVTLKDNTFPQLLLLIEFAHDAADRIYKAIVASTDGTAALQPILRPYDTSGSTRYVDFDTTRPVFATRDDKCHISHVVADTASWEQKMAAARGRTRQCGRRRRSSLRPELLRSRQARLAPPPDGLGNGSRPRQVLFQDSPRDGRKRKTA